MCHLLSAKGRIPFKPVAFLKYTCWCIVSLCVTTVKWSTNRHSCAFYNYCYSGHRAPVIFLIGRNPLLNTRRGLGRHLLRTLILGHFNMVRDKFPKQLVNASQQDRGLDVLTFYQLAGVENKIIRIHSCSNYVGHSTSNHSFFFSDH